jgi:hypothetical protein
MAQMEGKFNNYKNENLDEFYAAIGVYSHLFTFVLLALIKWYLVSFA